MYRGGRLLSVPGSTRGKLTGEHMAPGLERPYVFAKMLLVEEQSSRQEKEYKELCTIRVKTHYVRWLRDSSLPEPKPKLQEAITSVSERTKKVVQHCVQMGKPTIVPPTQPVAVDEIMTYPIVEFVFSYASKEFLQAQGVIEVPLQLVDSDVEVVPDSGPSLHKSKRKRAHTGVKRDEDNDSAYLEGEDAEAYRKLRQKIARKKQGPKREVVSDDDVTVVEPQSKVKGEVIDLTDD